MRQLFGERDPVGVVRVRIVAMMMSMSSFPSVIGWVICFVHGKQKLTNCFSTEGVRRVSYNPSSSNDQVDSRNVLTESKLTNHAPDICTCFDEPFEVRRQTFTPIQSVLEHGSNRLYDSSLTRLTK